MRRSAVTCVIAFAVVSFVMVRAVVQAETNAGFAIILRNGTVLDGTGASSYRADLGITGGVIAKIGDLRGERAAVDLDVAGLFIAPGFINLHSHSATDALSRAENLLTQGVTTVILYSDGIGPVDGFNRMARLGSRGLAVNVGAYIGFNAVWESVMGLRDRRPTAEDIARMRSLVVRGLEAGAWGVSAGLEYTPAYYARTDEVIRVVEAAARWRTNFPNHERVTPESNFSSKVGIMETMAIAEAARLVAVITHMKARGPERGNAAALIERMETATKRGYYTAADVYPYLAGQGGLGALLIPRWAQEGGRTEMLNRFSNLALRARIVAETEQALERLGSPESVYLSASKQELVDIMRQDGVSAGEAIVRVVEKGNVPAILRFGVESDLVEILRNPTTSIACDCDATTSRLAHPRSYGTFPRVLGRYVREQMVLTWEDAIRKMTALPANTIGMIDRGFLAVGMAADVTVFDPKTISDRATYEDPARLAEGIRYVIVNGRVALRDGEVTGEQSGQVLKRTIHMPSRAMSTDRTRRTSARQGTLGAVSGQEASAADYQVEFDVRQKAGARKAEGSLRVIDLRSKTMIQSTDLGLLQTVDRWATFTGRARFSFSPEEKAFTVIVEQSDPLVPNRATVNVSAEGFSLRGFVDPLKVEISASVP